MAGKLLLLQFHRASKLVVVSLHVWVVLITADSQLPPPVALPGCPTRCGGTTVPYPFGFVDGCYRYGFRFMCNDTADPPLLYTGSMQILDINLPQGEIRAKVPVGRDCYSAAGAPMNVGIISVNLTLSPFVFSSTRNRFTVTGCDTSVSLSDPAGFGFSTGCVSACRSMKGVKNDTCSGIGCCATAIPQGLKYFRADFSTFSNHTGVWSFNPCSYAFVVENGAFQFNSSFLSADYTNTKLKMPAVLDWVMEAKTCEAAEKDFATYACRSANSVCLPATSSEIGYLCNCSTGFRGNPYLLNGCRDIDECQSPDIYPCNGICTNMPGSYDCSCPPGSHADDSKTEDCIPDPVTIQKDLHLAVKLVLGIGSALIFILFIVSWIFWGIHKRMMAKLRQKLFIQNGGLFLQQHLSTLRRHNSSHHRFKIFTVAEMRRATKKFDNSRILGEGANGVVYRGNLDDGRAVAIKKTTVLDESRNKEFAKEMFIVSQINHVNVVKLVGCCLEVQIPLLVYEYMPNGTLSQFLLHAKNPTGHPVVPWSLRLKLAVEAARAVDYLHSKASPPILHGDIKSSNMLLDENYTVKVADFGTSSLAPKDSAQVMTTLRGTLAYLDPIYMQTATFTAKSDVYSFGVVLLEMISGKEAICSDKGGNKSYLSSIFMSCVERDSLVEIIDSDIAADELMPQFQAVAGLAKRCLSLKGEDRPTMAEITKELEDLTTVAKHKQGQGCNPSTATGESHEKTTDRTCDTSGAFNVKNHHEHDPPTGTGEMPSTSSCDNTGASRLENKKHAQGCDPLTGTGELHEELPATSCENTGALSEDGHELDIREGR